MYVSNQLKNMCIHQQELHMSSTPRVLDFSLELETAMSSRRSSTCALFPDIADHYLHVGVLCQPKTKHWAAFAHTHTHREPESPSITGARWDYLIREEPRKEIKKKRFRFLGKKQFSNLITVLNWLIYIKRSVRLESKTNWECVINTFQFRDFVENSIYT